ncbi:FHA domain-containing protein [Nannocystaceae bacterium ST9]
MIVCPNCGKENQDHYKFCLGCGAKLPAAGQAAAPPPPPPPGATAMPPPVVPPLPSPPVAPPAQAYAPPPQQYAAPPQYPPAPPPAYPPQQSYGPPSSYAAPPAAQVPPDFGTQATQPPPPKAQPSMRKCPVCATENPMQFKFCGACGGRMDEPTTVGPAPQPPAPQPPAPAPAPAPAPPMAPPPAAEAGTARTMFMDAGPPRPAPARTAMIRLVLLRDDGSEGGVLVIEGGPEAIGRMHGPPFDSDAYLDPNHAEFAATPQGLQINDLDSLNGVYIKLDGRAELHDLDMFRVGQELMLYEDLPEPAPTDEGTEIMGSPNPGYWGRVSVMVSRERAIAAFPIQNEGVTIGRENGDITFPDDGYVSGTHCRVVGDETGVYIEDLGSSNGTYMRVRSGQIIEPGRLILVGQQLFRIETG